MPWRADTLRILEDFGPEELMSGYAAVLATRRELSGADEGGRLRQAARPLHSDLLLRWLTTQRIQSRD